MKIGIKYCGGCNPRYDRSHMTAQLLKSLPDAEPVYDTGVYCPIWLVVCGCPSACVDTGPLRAGEIITVSSAKEFYPLKAKLLEKMTSAKDSDLLELSVGMTASRTRTFGQDDLLAFARLSGDTNGVHLDPAVADLTMFRRPIVHGIFVGTLFSAILGTELPGSGTVLMSEETEYTGPSLKNMRNITGKRGRTSTRSPI